MLNRVSDFLDENGAWIKEWLDECFWRSQEDFLAWHPERSGLLTLRSAYRLATMQYDEVFAGGSSSSHPDGERPMWKVICKQ